jgi:phosphoserine phosphatase
VSDRLPSWRPGSARDALEGFLDGVLDVPVDERVACFDNDGTLWCERPTYVQFDFFVDALRSAVRADPGRAETPEFAALLAGDQAAIGDVGLERIALALTSLFEGITPEEFTRRARTFMAGAQHATLGRPLLSNVYVPMLELIEELRRCDVTVAVVTGGGTEFVRAVSQQLYGVPPEAVVGTLIGYEYGLGVDGSPRLLRTGRPASAANEGSAKVNHIQSQLGRRPRLVAGNSGGDREMLEWAASGEGPTLALLVNHDDAEREFAYTASAEASLVKAGELGWTVVSMKDDWSVLYGKLAD